MGFLFFYKKPFIISKQLSYNKDEKLKSRKLIQHLFDEGKSFSVFPVKVLYDAIEDTAVPIKAGVAVSSRRFKKAVDRNRIKRTLREVYRQQKLPLQNTLAEKRTSFAVFFIYTGKELPVFNELYQKMGIILQRLQSQVINLPLPN